MSSSKLDLVPETGTVFVHEDRKRPPADIELARADIARFTVSELKQFDDFSHFFKALILTSSNDLDWLSKDRRIDYRAVWHELSEKHGLKVWYKNK